VSFDWIQLAQDRVQWRDVLKTVLNLRDPRKARNFLANWETISFLKKYNTPWSIYLRIITCKFYLIHCFEFRDGIHPKGADNNVEFHVVFVSCEWIWFVGRKML